MSFAAYLSMYGEKLISATKLGKTYKFEFFKTPQIEKLKLSFLSSESARFDAAVRNIKRLCYSDKRSYNGDLEE